MPLDVVVVDDVVDVGRGGNVVGTVMMGAVVVVVVVVTPLPGPPVPPPVPPPDVGELVVVEPAPPGPAVVVVCPDPPPPERLPPDEAGVVVELCTLGVVPSVDLGVPGTAPRRKARIATAAIDTPATAAALPQWWVIPGRAVTTGGTRARLSRR